ncbi:efflux RND transporter periplasmic adaptor subunit [Leeia oryzae]|uniref:efflux RND transporter periplasmic adaptor subunit n=1 Tax=Leeia oryzae TaxID=356662 RepID=UPI0003788054|nr:efflux RND transporter periplasmic adaptor subunit [Leeia oryzae]
MAQQKKIVIRTLSAAMMLVATGLMAKSAPQVAVAQWQMVSAGYRAEAVVEAVQQSAVSAQTQGQVVMLSVKVGDRVKAGQVLARLDDKALSQGVSASTAQVQAAQAQLANASANLRRTQSLVAQKFMSQAMLDTAQSQYDAALASVKALKANAGQMSTNKDYAIVKAPFDGVVSQVSTEVGQMAAPGTPLLTVFAPGGLRAVAHVPQASISELDARSPAKIQLNGKDWQPAGATTVLPAADPVTHTREVRVALPASTAYAPGQTVSVWFATSQTRRLVVPASSILRRSELSLVYVLSGNGKFLLRQVRLGEDMGPAGVEILAGVQAGEKVALNPVAAGLGQAQ